MDGPSFTDEMHIRASMMLVDPMDAPDAGGEEIGEEKKTDPLRPMKTRTPSVAFREGETATIQKVLQEIDNIEQKQYQKGFREVNFSVGVMNSLLLAHSFGAYPQHFWLVYLVEAFYLLPRKFFNMVKAKPLNQALYYLDFCWMMNFLGLVILILLIMDSVGVVPLSQEIRKNIFLGTFGIGCGPLFGASVVFPFVALVFHDITTMTGLFIHILPPLLNYTLRWHGDEIKEAWSGVFDLDCTDDIKFIPEKGLFEEGSVAGNAIIIYFLWFIPYVSWMILIGMDLPRTHRHKKQRDGSTPQPPLYDTVFHSWMRGGSCEVLGTALWKRPKSVSMKMMETNDFEVRDFLVYMTAHAILSLLSIFVIAYPCYASRTMYRVFILVVIFICVFRGGKRYTYYTTKMYGRLLRKQFEAHCGMDGTK